MINITILNWEEIEQLVRKTYSLGRNDNYKQRPVPDWVSQADVRKLSDALAYLMMGGVAPKPTRPLR